jgi:hypothetical protein
MAFALFLYTHSFWFSEPSFYRLLALLLGLASQLSLLSLYIKSHKKIKTFSFQEQKNSTSQEFKLKTSPSIFIRSLDITPNKYAKTMYKN